MAATEPQSTYADQARDPLRVVRIKPSRSWLSLNLGEVWTYRELLYFLVWRDVKVRYKQTAVGAAWAVLQPLLQMVVLTLVFSVIAQMSSDGTPYPVFAYVGLLPWNFFSSALSRCAGSVVGQANLVSKIYFPRLIMPVSAAVSGIVDFGIAFGILLAMMAAYGIAPGWNVLLLPIFIALALITALSVGIWLAALNVRYRDVGYIVPLLVQLWLFASPVAYPISRVPEKWRFLYSLNPMTGVVEGFRWALLPAKETPDFGVMAVSTLVLLALLFGGIVHFKRMERTFADVV